MSRKRLRRYIERLMTLQGQSPTRDRLLMKLGAAKHHAGRAAGQVKVTWPKEAFGTASLEFSLDRQRLRQERRRKGHYLLRNNLSARDPAQQWTFFASTSPRSSRPSRRSSTTWRSAPIFHKTEERIEAHILVAYLACCL